MSKTHEDGFLIPSVGYLRSSTVEEEISIEEQRKSVEQYADEHRYRIIRWYTDDGVSGDETKRRLDFLRMIEDAAAKRDFRAILCWDRARFGRFDSIKYGYHVHRLRQARVFLATVMEGKTDWNDLTTRIVAGVAQEGKHQQLLDHSANVTRGQMHATQNGSWIGSAPFGYKKEGSRKSKRLIVGDQAHAHVVQRIFREFVNERRSMNDIAKRLQKDGHGSPGGRRKPWRFDTVKVILENPAYTGDVAAGRYT